MKRKLQTLSTWLMVPGLLIFLASCTKDNDDNNGVISTISRQVSQLPREPLNTDERNSLVFMREEEKLARDVYQFMYAKWGTAIFQNIAKSEQTHMDAVLLLLNKYNLPDPVGDKGPGEFSNSSLQSLYNLLVNQGSVSQLAALKTGATIEDLDIYDLNIALTKVDNKDIRLVYENLAKGSRNHLRSFYSLILLAGGTYTPQYITQAEFDAIISSPMETGNPW